jgi:hypothetical protein
VNRRERRALRELELSAAEQPASLVAAAVNVKAMGGFQSVKFGATDWQQEGWAHYDSCPEFHQAINIIAFNLSRARLIGVDIDPVTGEPATSATDDPDVVDVMSQFYGGPTGQSQALDRLGRHLSVAGDSWTLATDRPEADQAVWEILGTTEVSGGNGGRIMVQQMDGTPRPVDTDRELLIRMWRPHPKRRWEADSMTRSLLPVLRELSALSSMVAATVKSRLAAAGILWIPDDITLPKSVVNAANDDTQTRSESSGAAGWLDLITEAMTAPIRDPDSASTVVPLVAVVKGDSIAKILHMEFGRDLDATIQPLREACVRRLAVGVDMPPSILTGMETANHWSAWTISEDFAKAFLAPLLELIVDAATKFYLRPALASRGVDGRRFAVWFDLSALFPRQISVDNAQSAYDAGLLSNRKYLEALGFAEADMADDQERARRLIEDIMKRGNPQTLEELAPSIAVLYPGLIVQPLPAAPAAVGGRTTPPPTPPVGTEPTPPPPSRQTAPTRPATRPGPPPAPPGGGP